MKTSTALLLGDRACGEPASAQGRRRRSYPPSGFDLTAMDRSTKPGDDFFQYANGEYLDRAVIPADRPIGLAAARDDRPDGSAAPQPCCRRPRNGVGEQPADVKGKVGAFYAAFMDEATIDRLGVAPSRPSSTRSAPRPTRPRSPRLMGQSRVGFYPALVRHGIDIDLKAPDRYAIYLSQSGLGLPDRDYYLKPEFAAQREAYRAYAREAARR